MPPDHTPATQLARARPPFPPHAARHADDAVGSRCAVRESIARRAGGVDGAADAVVVMEAVKAEGAVAALQAMERDGQLPEAGQKLLNKFPFYLQERFHSLGRWNPTTACSPHDRPTMT